ncbi:MAG: Gfo/Idh/MocA family oxidoreductase [Gemmatimonadota bacterium]
MFRLAADGPRPERLRLAFLGCGRVTGTHSRVLRRVVDVERYYASRDPRRAQAYAAALRGSGHFDSYAGALADPAIDVVLIATPPATHLELVLRALEAGKHVIVEKPAFPRSADFGPAERAARDAGRLLFVAENYFYKPLARTLRRLIASGDLGDIRFVHVDATKRQDATGWRGDSRLSGGGALFEGGIHWISLMGHLGLTPIGIEGFRAGDAPERSSAVVIRYAEGAVGTLLHSWDVGSRLRGLRLSHVRGTLGSATFESNGAFLIAGGRRPRLMLPGVRDLLGYRAMFADVLDAIRGGVQPLYTLEAARRDLRLAEAACGPETIENAGEARLAWTF